MKSVRAKKHVSNEAVAEAISFPSFWTWECDELLFVYFDASEEEEEEEEA